MDITIRKGKRGGCFFLDIACNATLCSLNKKHTLKVKASLLLLKGHRFGSPYPTYDVIL